MTVFVYRALSRYYNSTEISHLTSYPQTSSSNNQEFIAISIFFFRDGINGDGMIQCVVIDNQIGVKT